MEVATRIAAIRSLVESARARRLRIGLVPTMGALHAGHGALIDQARAECAFVVATIFVNPTQFDRADDYQRYPRTFEQDSAFCRSRGVDAVFAPEATELYPEPLATVVDVPDLSRFLCGPFRPGHFRGVATVVAKLFQIVLPDAAYFGEKDAQQLAIIERMTRDLNMPLEVRAVPTVREPDGLAMSSRNQRLTADERRIAPVLFRALDAARRKAGGGCKDPADVKAEGLRVLESEPSVRVEYLEIVGTATMAPVDRIAGPVRIAAAVWLGSTRLIDNVLCAP